MSGNLLIKKITIKHQININIFQKIIEPQNQEIAMLEDQLIKKRPVQTIIHQILTDFRILKGKCQKE